MTVYLPLHLLEEISDYLDFKGMIKFGNVCQYFKNFCWDLVWSKTDIDFSPNMNYRKDRSVNFKVTNFTAGDFRLFFYKCKQLEYLRIVEEIGTSNFVGRYFYLMKSITHISLEMPINYIYLVSIEEHFSHQLISLGLVLNNRKQTIEAFISLLSKCKKLECLRINRFNNIYERALAIGQTHFLPSTLKLLYLTDSDPHVYNEVLIRMSTRIDFLMYVCLNEISANIQMLNFHSKFYLSNNIAFLILHPTLNSLRALKIQSVYLDQTSLTNIANSCPLLEHIDFQWKNYVDEDEPLQKKQKLSLLDEPVQVRRFLDFRQLEALYSFKKLSSLSITIILEDSASNSIPFHQYLLDEGVKIDEFFIEILVGLNSITPLRNLELREVFFNKEYLLKIFKNLKNLQTFKCTLAEETDESDEFFKNINENLNEGMLKTFRFVTRFNEDILFKWKCIKPYKLEKTPTIPLLKDVNFCQSIVLEEIFNDSFGSRNTKILFCPYKDSLFDYYPSSSTSFGNDEE
ncbi:hypothetical protein ACQ4LE_009608 [Meloidogyne hapla]